MPSQTSLVRAGYEQMAKQYAASRHFLRSDQFVSKFEQHLPRQASVLDLGCGNGLPVASYLLKKGHLVTGVDISPTQIKLAQKNCPRGEFLVADIAELSYDQYKVDGVVCLYALFHLPRTLHLRILKTINSFLPIGGQLLLTMGDKDFEGTHLMFGAKMWSSHYGPNINSRLVKDAGFEIDLDEVSTSGQEKHQFILAKKTTSW